ncbi:Cullin-associated nedd8-dissociated protein 1 [Mycena chlorophos]|uniref:Cullin-associated nedd8-dissociated protein 1 n=1 Tax=Mycena chlorophos TaxID=658473 RepID=A0A8H6WKG3_MYCCL|nr:Cullin-associated nedd8-dissociated protein 1 [Mycena chlorophos]
MRVPLCANMPLFVPISQPQPLKNLLSEYVFPFLCPNMNLDKQRTTVRLFATVAGTAPTQITAMLGGIVPGVVKAVVQRDDDELREGSMRLLLTTTPRSSVPSRRTVTKPLWMSCPACRAIWDASNGHVLHPP